MKRKGQLLLILGVVVLVTAGVSHFLAHWLGLETTAGRAHRIGAPEYTREAFEAGSSLAGYAISWDQVSSTIQNTILAWGVAGSSPWEWEPFQGRATDVTTSFLVISAYDLNEQFLCDFHADVVPMHRTVRDLRQSGVDWQFSKRVLSQYPLKYVRMLFPTVGRSQGVMAGARDKVRQLMGKAPAEAKPTMATDQPNVQDAKTERLSDWSTAKALRRLALMRNACQGKHSYNGPKKLAFLRMLQQASQRGSVVVVVLPVSQFYEREFLSPELKKEFEEALAEAQRTVPSARFVRLDQVPNLNADENFCDFVHINTYGQHIATEAFLSKLKEMRAAL